MNELAASPLIVAHLRTALQANLPSRNVNVASVACMPMSGEIARLCPIVWIYPRSATGWSAIVSTRHIGDMSNLDADFADDAGDILSVVRDALLAWTPGDRWEAIEQITRGETTINLDFGTVEFPLNFDLPDSLEAAS